jgi:hypothetical protein
MGPYNTYGDTDELAEYKRQAMTAQRALIVEQERTRVLLEACKHAAELIKTARQHFPKSIHHADKFQLENTCACISYAIAKAEWEA